jgi:uncharacterized membrane protein
MTKAEFMRALREALREKNIGDIDEILEEYEQHFALKLSDGYSEEETAARLGDPAALAGGYEPDAPRSAGLRSRALTVAGLVWLDIFAASLFIILFAWVFVLLAAAAALAGIGAALVLRNGLYGILPPMPYFVALLFAVAFFALSALAAVGTRYCWAYARQLGRCYARFHKNTLSAASGAAPLPPLPAHPQFQDATRRRLRALALVSVTVFAAASVLSYIAGALAAGSLGFWHAWGWFV